MSLMQSEDFVEQTLELDDDYEGKVVATLISSSKNEGDRSSILYIHGLSDYFFQTHVAETFYNNGYNFYALDLRKHGRSLLPHQHPNYCRSIREYYEEIDRALQIIASQNSGEIILFGHSTGGLTSSLYLNEGKNRKLVDKLILNSPFLQFNMKPLKRAIILPLTGLISTFFPFISQKKPFSHLYGSSISNQKKGEWEYNTDWKPLKGFPAYLKWVYAMYTGQKKLHETSSIDLPVLLLHSEKSGRYKSWNNEILKTDMVLNIEHMKYYGKKLGPDVTLAEIPNAMHDVFLSGKEVRELAFQKMFKWLNKKST